MKSKKTLVLIATLALVAVGVTLFVLSRGIKGYAHSVTALDGGQGLVTLWSNDGDGARQWLALNDADGTERWRVETSPLAPPIVEIAVATADADRVYVIES